MKVLKSLNTPALFWLWLLYLGLLLLFIPDSPGSINDLAELAAANSLAQQGRADINTLIWSEHTSNPPGEWRDDGNLYLRPGIRPSFVMIPLIKLGQNLPGLNTFQMGRLISVIFIALGAAVISLGIVRMGRASARWIWIIIGVLTITILGLGLFTTTSDVMWRVSGSQIAWHIVFPPLIIIFMAAVNLIVIIRNGTPTMSYISAAAITLILLGQTMLGAAHIIAKPFEAQATMLASLIDRSSPDDTLIITETAGNIQSTTSYMLAYPNTRMPTYIWTDAIQPLTIPPIERIWPTLQTAHVWLMEVGLQENDPLRETAAFLSQVAFPVSETGFDDDGRVTQYAITTEPITPVSMDVPFESGLTLVDFGIAANHDAHEGLLLVRLTWAMEDVTLDETKPPIVAFVHLLNDAQSGGIVAQVDRILVDFASHHQSPLLPEQTVSQGYALSLPDDLEPGGYSIIVGLYEASTIQRLPRADNSPDDFLYLTTVQLP